MTAAGRAPDERQSQQQKPDRPPPPNQAAGQLRFTNPDRVLYPDVGLIKLGLAEYYFSVAPRLLPHLQDRPLSLLRGPKGLSGERFFQKRPPRGLSDAVKRVQIAGKDGSETHLIADNLEAVLSLIQFNTLEFHIWSSRIDMLERPDRFTVDLDPADDVPWSNVCRAAREIRDVLVTGFSIASYYACSLLRGGSVEYGHRAMSLGLWMAIVATPLQMAVGDWAAKVVAESQPVKLASMEGQYKTESRAPLRIGGIPDDEAELTRYAIEIPGLLSWMAYSDINAEVQGLEEVAPEDRPPTLIVHMAFQVMVGIGSWCMLIAVWAAGVRFRYGQFPTSPWFYRAIVVSGPLSMLALEAGWVVTEVGRQPWIVQGVMRTAEAVTDAPGVWFVFWTTIGVYSVLAAATIFVLRLLARTPLPESTDAT